MTEELKADIKNPAVGGPYRMDIFDKGRALTDSAFTLCHLMDSVSKLSQTTNVVDVHREMANLCLTVAKDLKAHFDELIACETRQ